MPRQTLDDVVDKVADVDIRLFERIGPIQLRSIDWGSQFLDLKPVSEHITPKQAIDMWYMAGVITQGKRFRKEFAELLDDENYQRAWEVLFNLAQRGTAGAPTIEFTPEVVDMLTQYSANAAPQMPSGERASNEVPQEGARYNPNADALTSMIPELVERTRELYR